MGDRFAVKPVPDGGARSYHVVHGPELEGVKDGWVVAEFKLSDGNAEVVGVPFEGAFAFGGAYVVAAAFAHEGSIV